MNISDVPTTWAKVKIGEIFEFCYGKALSKSSRSGGGSIPVYGSNGITGYHDQPLIEGPCLLVGRKGAAGKVSLARDGCWPIDTTYYVVPPKDIDLDFCFRSFQVQRFEKFEKSTAIPSLSRDDAYQQEIPLPPLAEQRRIVAKIEELFSELDVAEENLRSARQKLGVYRQALLKQAFEGKLTEKWREENPDLQFSPFESGMTCRLLPSGWRYAMLGSTIENPAYGTSKKCSYESGGLGVLRIPNVVKGAIDADDIKYAEFTNDEVASYELKFGDLLLIRSNRSVSIVGRCALVEAKHTGLLYAGYLIRLRPIKSVIDSPFLRTQLGSLKLRSQIESFAKSTSGVNNINSKEIQRLVIALPPLPEQQEIVRLLDEQFTVIDQNEREITAALKRSEALRQSILKKAFTGQLVPQDPADEPASALLERIREERESKPTAPKRKVPTKVRANLKHD